MKINPPPMAYITTYDYANAKGYEVRLKYPHGYIKQFFGAAKNGGKKKALKAARRFRNRTIKRYGAPQPMRFRLSSKRNRSGCVGVCRIVFHKRRNRKVYRYPTWVAQYQDRKFHTVRRAFGVRTHGERRARQLAIATRKQWELKIRTGKA